MAAATPLRPGPISRCPWTRGNPIAFLDRVNGLYDKALATYETYKDRKPLAAVGALNTCVAILAHIRAVEGLEAPKEVRADLAGNVVITERSISC